MPENQVPSPPPRRLRRKKPPFLSQIKVRLQRKPAAAEVASDAGHVPITEEFDKAKWTLPPAKIVLIAIGIVAVVLGILAFVQRPLPGASGTLDDVRAVSVGDNSVLVSIQITLRNTSDKAFQVHAIKAHLKTADGQWDDTAASPVDFERYFQAFPDLRQSGVDALNVETRIPAGKGQSGLIVVSFPVSKDNFDKRQSLSVILTPSEGIPVTVSK